MMTEDDLTALNDGLIGAVHINAQQVRMDTDHATSLVAMARDSLELRAQLAAMTDSKMPEPVAWRETDGDSSEVGMHIAQFPHLHTGDHLLALYTHPAPVADAKLDRLIKDAEFAIEVMQEAETFPTAQGIFRDLITALRARTAQPVWVRVKSLEWGPYDNPVFAGPDVAIADAEFSHRYQVQRDPWAATYIAILHPRLPITSSTLWWESKGHADLAAAKAAAQADYEQRILSAILPDGGCDG